MTNCAGDATPTSEGEGGNSREGGGGGGGVNSHNNSHYTHHPGGAVSLSAVIPRISSQHSVCWIIFNLLVVSPGKGGEDRKIVYNNIKTIIKFI